MRCICDKCGKEFEKEDLYDCVDSYGSDDDDDYFEDDDYWYEEDDNPEDYPDWDGDESMMYWVDHCCDEEYDDICPECANHAKLENDNWCVSHSNETKEEYGEEDDDILELFID